MKPQRSTEYSIPVIKCRSCAKVTPPSVHNFTKAMSDGAECRVSVWECPFCHMVANYDQPPDVVGWTSESEMLADGWEKVMAVEIISPQRKDERWELSMMIKR